MKTKRIVGYGSAREACAAAMKMGIVGLTGSGQKCGPEMLPDGSFAYRTAYNVFGGDPEGQWLVPEGLLDFDQLFTGSWSLY